MGDGDEALTLCQGFAALAHLIYQQQGLGVYTVSLLR